MSQRLHLNCRRECSGGYLVWGCLSLCATVGGGAELDRGVTAAVPIDKVAACGGETGLKTASAPASLRKRLAAIQSAQKVLETLFFSPPFLSSPFYSPLQSLM